MSASADAGMERDESTAATSRFTDDESSSSLGPSLYPSANIERRDWTYDEGSGPSIVGGGGMTWEIDEFERKQLIRQVERSAARRSMEGPWVDSDDERGGSTGAAIGTDTADGSTPLAEKKTIHYVENAVPGTMNGPAPETSVRSGFIAEKQAGFSYRIHLIFKTVGELIGFIVTSMFLRPVRVLRSKVFAVLPWLDGSWWNVEPVKGKASTKGKDANEDDGDADMWRAMRKLWSFCAPNRGFIAAATICLILAAVRESLYG